MRLQRMGTENFNLTSTLDEKKMHENENLPRTLKSGELKDKRSAFRLSSDITIFDEDGKVIPMGEQGDFYRRSFDLNDLTSSLEDKRRSSWTDSGVYVSRSTLYDSIERKNDSLSTTASSSSNTSPTSTQSSRSSYHQHNKRNGLLIDDDMWQEMYATKEERKIFDHILTRASLENISEQPRRARSESVDDDEIYVKKNRLASRLKKMKRSFRPLFFSEKNSADARDVSSEFNFEKCDRSNARALFREEMNELTNDVLSRLEELSVQSISEVEHLRDNLNKSVDSLDNLPAKVIKRPRKNRSKLAQKFLKTNNNSYYAEDKINKSRQTYNFLQSECSNKQSMFTSMVDISNIRDELNQCECENCVYEEYLEFMKFQKLRRAKLQQNTMLKKSDTTVSRGNGVRRKCSEPARPVSFDQMTVPKITCHQRSMSAVTVPHMI